MSKKKRRQITINELANQFWDEYDSENFASKPKTKVDSLADAFWKEFDSNLETKSKKIVESENKPKRARKNLLASFISNWYHPKSDDSYPPYIPKEDMEFMMRTNTGHAQDQPPKPGKLTSQQLEERRLAAQIRNIETVSATPADKSKPSKGKPLHPGAKLTKYEPGVTERLLSNIPDKKLRDKLTDIASVPENIIRGLDVGGKQMIAGTANLGSLTERLITRKDKSVMFDQLRDDFEKAAQEAAESGNVLQGPIGKFARTSATAVPEILTTVYAGGALAEAASKIPWLFKAVTKYPGLVKMLPFSTLAGSHYAREAQQEGANNWQQALYGLAGGALEGLTEKYMFGNLEEVLSGGKKALQKSLINIPFEAGQEAGIDPLTGLAKKAIYKHDMPWYGDNGVVDLKQIGEDALAGAGTAVLLGGAGMAVNVPAHQRQLVNKMHYQLANEIAKKGVTDVNQAVILGGAMVQKAVQENGGVNYKTLRRVAEMRQEIAAMRPVGEVSPETQAQIDQAAEGLRSVGVPEEAIQNSLNTAVTNGLMEASENLKNSAEVVPEPVAQDESVPEKPKANLGQILADTGLTDSGIAVNQPYFSGAPGMFTPIAQPAQNMLGTTPSEPFNENILKNIPGTEEQEAVANQTPEKMVNKFIDETFADNVSVPGLAKATGKSIEYKKVNQREVDDIKNLLGIDVTGFSHKMNASGLRHIIKEHGNPTTEVPRGQVPITVDDLKKIPDVIENYDWMELREEEHAYKHQGIVYRKKVDGHIYFVEVIGTGKKALTAKTMWKTSSGGVDAVTPQSNPSTIDVQNATSMKSSTNDFIIAQPEEKVKTSNQPSMVSTIADKFLALGWEKFVAEKSAKSLAGAIEKGTYTDLLHPRNTKSRAIYEELTGKKLPKTVGGTKAMIEGTYEEPKKYRIATKDGIKTVDGYPVNAEGSRHSFFVHKTPAEKGKPVMWNVFETSTGLRVTSGRPTKEGAVDAFNSFVTSKGVSVIDDVADKAKKLEPVTHKKPESKVPETPQQNRVAPKNVAELKKAIIDVNQGRVSEEQADALVELVKGVAKYKGISVDQYIQERITGLEQGGELPKNSSKVLYRPVAFSVNLDEMVDVINLDRFFPNVISDTPQELTKFVKSLVGQRLSSRDQKAIISIINKHADHVVRSGSPVPRAIMPERNAAIRSIVDLIKNSVYIETLPNDKIAPIEDWMTSSQKKTQGQKNQIKNYYRFYVPISVKDHMFAIRIVAAERKDTISINSKELELFDLVIENKKNRSDAANLMAYKTANGFSNVASSGFKISIRQMLEGVKDAKGNLYIDENQLNQKQDGMVKAAVVFDADNKAIIHAFQASNVADVAHELAHIFRRDLTPEDMQIAAEWAGAKDGEWDREAEENFARGFEEYLLEGKAPNSRLKRIFEQFKEWLLAIYKHLRNSVKLTSEIRQMFDRLVSGNEVGKTIGQEYNGNKVKNIPSLSSEPKDVEPKHFSQYVGMVGNTIQYIKNAIENGTFPTGPRVQGRIRGLISKEFGRVATEDEVTDVVEAAVQWYINEQVKGLPIEQAISKAAELETKLLPNFSRSMEKTQRQQFSTPVPIALAAARAANVRSGDNIIEGSAGTGSLIEAVAAQNPDVNVTAVELEPRRAAILEALKQRVGVTGFSVINDNTFNYMPKEKADVVIMNPPFRGASRMSGQERGGKAPWSGGWGDLGNRFIFHDLRRLKGGGRLVSITSPGVVDMDNKVNIPFRQWLKKNHTVRAFIVFPPNSYDTRGTTFGAGLLIVDKGKDVTAGELVIGKPATWEEFFELMKGVTGREVVSTGHKPQKTSTGTGDAGKSGGGGGNGVGTAGVNPSNRQPATAKVPGGSAPSGIAKPGSDVSSVSPVAQTTQSTTQLQQSGAVPKGSSAGNGDTSKGSGQGVQSAEVTGVKKQKSGTSTANDTGNTNSDVSAQFVTYTPEKVSGRKSPGKVVEPPTLAFVKGPEYLKMDPTLKPHQRVIVGNPKSGIGLSDIQLETVMAAKYSHKNGHGILIADDVGVGKTGSILGILGDGYFSSEFDRQVLVVKGEDFVGDNLVNDIEKFNIPIPYTFVRENPAFNDSTANDYAHKASEQSASGKVKEKPISDFTKHQLGNKWKPFPDKDGILVVTKEDMKKYSYAIYDWLKKSKKESRVVVDEAHYFKNTPDDSAKNAGSDMGAVLRGLWRDLKPEKGTQFVYCSATSGESLDDIEYLYDLGLWDASPNSFEQWKSGLTGQVFEKKSGRFGGSKNDPFSRNIPLTLMEQIIRELKARGQYFGRQQSLDGVEIEPIPVELTPQQIGEINSVVDIVKKISDKIANYKGSRFKVIGGVLQYMRRISGHYRLMTAIADAKQKLAEAEKRGEKIRIAFSVDQFNAVPSRAPVIENLIEYIPTAYRDDFGETIEIPEAKWDKEELRAILDGQNPDYPNPLPDLPDMIEVLKEAFGDNKVAVINGSVSPKQRNFAKKEFRDLKRPILVFSKAGSTGINLHDETGNRVYMYHVDYDYDATTFKQREGRFNRTGQKTAPVFVYPFINSGIDTRFIGTIMARMQQMGAIARGKAGEVSSDELQQFNITGTAAKLATIRALARLEEQQRETVLGIKDSEGEEFERKTARISAKDYMNRLMLLPMDESVRARDVFMEELAAVRQDIENIGGIIDQFTTYKGKIVSESKNGSIRFLRIQTTDQSIVENAEKAYREAVEKHDISQRLLEKASVEGKKKIAGRKAKALEQAQKADEVEGELYKKYTAEHDQEKRQELYKKYLDARNKAGDARQKYQHYQNTDINVLLMNLAEYSRAARKYDETARRLETAKHNVEYSKEAVLIDGQVVTNGLMATIREAIDTAGKNKNIPAEARKVEFRGYLLVDGSRAVGPVIPEFAEEAVAKALGTELKAKEIGDNEVWDAVTNKRKTVHLSSGLSLEYSEYQKGVLIKGISATDNNVKEWYKTVTPDISFNPVSRVFLVNNETGLEKVLRKWPIKSQSAVEIIEKGALEQADAEIEQRLNESGVKFREGNSDSMAIAAGTFKWFNRVKNALDALFGDDSNKVTVSDSRVERMLTATKSPLNLKQQLRSAIHSVSTAFKDVFEYEWTVKEFPQFQDELRRFKGVARDAQKFALDKLVKITSFLESPKEYEIFRRLVFLRDLKAGIEEKEAEAFAAARRIGYDREEAGDIARRAGENIVTTGELTISQIEEAIEELWGQTDEHTQKRIEDAIWAHDKTFEALWDDLQERGKVPASAKHRESYVPHRVLDYMGEVDKRFPALSRRFKTPYRYYLQKRTGSTRLIDTDYTALTLKHFAKLYMDNAYDDFNFDVATKYDKYIRMSKEERQALGKLTPGRLYEVDDEQYRAWQYDPGRNYYLQESLTEETVMEILQDVLDPELKPEDRQLMFEAAMSRAVKDSKTFLAVGKHKRIYLLPVEIADRLTHFKSADFNSRMLNAVRSFHHYYKMVLFSPVTLGIPFHVNNAFGDALNLVRDDPEAMKYFKQAWQAVGEWQRGEVGKRFETVVELAEKYRVAESALMKNSGMPFNPQLKKLQPKRYIGRNLNPLTKWNLLAERRELTPRFAKLMADLRRIERGEMPVAQMLDVKKLAGAGMSTLEIAGKLAREVTVDYDKLTPEGKLILRDIALPFFTFYIQNFGNWFKYVKRKPGNFAAKFMIPLLAMTLWNWLRFPDEEEKLPVYYRVAPHIITGFKDKDGKMIIWSMQTPVEMAFRIVGLDVFPDLVRQVASGKKTVDKAALELAKSVALGPWETAKDLLTPLFKAPIEAFGNKSWFNGRPIVPREAKGTPDEWKYKLKYIIGQWFAPVGNWSRNARDNSIQKNLGSYLRKGPVDIPRAVGIRHVSLGQEQISRFYSRLEQLEGEYKQAKNMGRKFDGIGKLRRLRRYSQRFSEWYKRIDRIEKSKMPEKTKTQMIDRYKKAIAEKAETVLKVVQ